jgi:hypothetical protein
MTTRNFGWQSDDLEHTAEIDAGTIRWATVTDTFDDDRPYTGATEQKQPVADFLAGGPTGRVPIEVLEEMIAALGKPAPWLAPLRLQEAAAGGDMATTRALLGGGAKPNAVVRGRTALSAALTAQQFEAATVLLDGGADPNVRLEGGQTALHVAAKSAGSAAWATMLRALLAAKADLEARDDEGQTPLLAGLRGHLCKEGVDVLVGTRRAVNAASADGSTPLLAESRGWCRPSVVRMLLGAGADVNSRSKDGWSPLLWAITKNDLWFVKMLIDARADVNVVGQPHKQGQPARSALALAEFLATPPAGGLPKADPSNPQATLKRKALELAGQIVEALKAAGAK